MSGWRPDDGIAESADSRAEDQDTWPASAEAAEAALDTAHAWFTSPDPVDWDGRPG